VKWIPVRVKKTRQTKIQGLDSDSIRTEAPGSLHGNQRPPKQTVDDSIAALEIPARSSYVPDITHRRLIPASPAMRASTRRDISVWKCRYG
jgi:hypothetical protein